MLKLGTSDAAQVPRELVPPRGAQLTRSALDTVCATISTVWMAVKMSHRRVSLPFYGPRPKQRMYLISPWQHEPSVGIGATAGLRLDKEEA